MTVPLALVVPHRLKTLILNITMDIYASFDLLYDTLMFIILIPISLGLWKWRFLTNRERWVIGFLGVLLLHEVLAQICIKLRTRNHFLYYIQTVGVLCSVAGVYDSVIGRKQLLWQIAMVLSLTMMAEVLIVVGFNHINSITLSVSRLLLAICAFISLKRLFSDKTNRSLGPNSMLYIHLGFFLFGAFTAVNAYFKSYLIETSLELYYLFNTMSAIVSAISFGLFSVGFLRVKPLHKVELS